MKTYNIGITDDHVLFAEGLSNIISGNPDLQLAFVAASVPEMFSLLRHHPIDFLLLDINLPPYNGLELLTRIKEEYKTLKIMILSMYQPSDIGLNLANFKGDAYVLKISGKNILEEAIEGMKKGVLYLDPNIITLHTFEDSFTQQLRLTKREKEIISLIAIGKTSKEIAEALFVAELTIKTHRKNIGKKLGTKNVANLISKMNGNAIDPQTGI
ncbi:LuxR C-terminal-related transcriptional regulator [Pedobacter caeni]|uniref:Two component transcriptional regulator, LuxR family n=1 Tax=Pedobacter caeni TaxID=288992 RepID=A0A1M5F256_9SPHI|nr:response regulator transcription factor [Pedobacter caeni]SHF85537.1 two component transcriptional regulator, LuxR family [Pedobacter caeni]